MNLDLLLTITLLIVIACSMGVLNLWFGVVRQLGMFMDLMHLTLHRLTEAADRQRGMKQALLEDGKLTRQRISQVKTRMADEESEDQSEKRRARYHRQTRVHS